MKKSLFILTLAILTLAWVFYPSKAYDEVTYVYTVHTGDTVYSIVSELATKNDNINKIVYNTIKENNIKAGELEPGTEIKIRLPRIKK